MALSKADLVSGLREGLQVKSYLNEATMWLGAMVEYIDKNLHDFAGQSLERTWSRSKLNAAEMTVGEMAAWCDYHLNVTVPNVIRLENRRPQPYYTLIRHQETGAVYNFRPGDRPIFKHVANEHRLHFLNSSGLSGSWPQVIEAETNLIEFLHQELIDMAIDTSQIQAIIPAPPKTEIYIVVRGDTFGGIAKARGITVDALKALNPQITNIDNITEGQEITVPYVPK